MSADLTGVSRDSYQVGRLTRIGEEGCLSASNSHKDKIAAIRNKFFDRSMGIVIYWLVFLFFMFLFI